ncbi:hypothetical protein [Burkholderia cenocepacia]|nr:hypothetical protein [Burkholderia cenocepacia]
MKPRIFRRNGVWYAEKGMTKAVATSVRSLALVWPWWPFCTWGGVL